MSGITSEIGQSTGQTQRGLGLTFEENGLLRLILQNFDVVQESQHVLRWIFDDKQWFQAWED